MANSDTDNTGLVVAAFGQRGILETATGEKIPYLIKGRRLRVVCGDRVHWTRNAREDTAIVGEILNRNNVLERMSPDQRPVEMLAANLSFMAIVFAPIPAPDWYLIDRYLCTAELMGCKAALIRNKDDLQAELSDEINDYIDLGYDCVSVSAANGSGLNIVMEMLQTETGILVGQSGVGKSSLINQLVPGADVVVNEVSATTLEGKHTTTASLMYQLPTGGRLIDTPGVRDFVPALALAEFVQKGYREIIAAADSCRFNDCKHLREPDCAVKQARDSGQISKRRYESYKRLLSYQSA